MSDDRENIPTLVGRAPCGCALAAAVVDPAEIRCCQDGYAESRKWQRAGWTVETRTVGWVRHTPASEGGLNWECPHRKRRRRKVVEQMELPK